MKPIVAIILCFSLSGCSYQHIDLVDIERATDYCKGENSEVYRLASHSVGFVSVECKNGKKAKVF